MAESESTAPLAPTVVPTVSSRLTVLDGLLVVAMIIWGSNFAVIKASLAVLSPFAFNFIRFVIGTAITGIILKQTGEQFFLSRRQLPPVIVAAFVSNVIYQTLFTYGLKNTSVGNSVLIIAMAPVWLILYKVLRGKDRLRRIGAIGILMAVSGVGVVIVSRYAGQLGITATTVSGDLLTILASFAWVVAVLAAQGPIQRYPVMTASFWVLAWGTVFEGMLALPDLLRLDWSTLTPNVWLGVLFSGICAVGIANAIWYRGIRHLGAARASVYVNLEPIVAAITAVVFLNEPFTPWLVMGTAFVLTGLWLIKKG